MSPAPRVLPRSRAWPRALALLLALLVPATHAEMHAASATAVSSGETAEHDILDTALRPASRAVHRPAAPLRPAPVPAPGPAAGLPQGRPLPAPPGPPYALHTLRSVVLRC